MILSDVNRKLIDAVIARAQAVCPGALELVGVYGSVATEDTHKKSDLDLLLLIGDEAGRTLSACFLLDDSGIGYDLYCTTWEQLRADAACPHAHIAKLMDSEIVYTGNPDAYDKLCGLRKQAAQFLASEERIRRADELIARAKLAYADAHLHETPDQVRLDACGVITYLLDAVMIYHGSYFRRGVRHTFEELAEIPVDAAFCDCLQKIVAEREIPAIRAHLTQLFSCAQRLMGSDRPKEQPSATLAGTYEEMVSNWRNKVELAAGSRDVFSSFMAMGSFRHMLAGIAAEVNIGSFPLLAEYNPDDLADNLRIYDRYLQQYEAIYQKAGIAVSRFADADAFVESYLAHP